MIDDEQTFDMSQETEPAASEMSTQDVHTADDVSTDGSKKPRGSIRPPAELYDEFIARKRDDESANDLLRRLIDASTDVDTLQGRIADLESDNEHKQKQIDDIRYELESDRQLANEQVDANMQRIEERDQQIEALELELHDKQTAVVTADGRAGMDSLGIKDVIEEAREMCGDDEMCGKIIGKLLDTKVHFASKASDQEHNATQNQLDRDQKELDRKSKADLAEEERKFKAEQAEKDQKNKIELALAKKGGFRTEFLEDVVFLSGGSPKQPGKEIERRKQQARAEADDEEEYFNPEAEEELMMPEDE